MNTRVEEPVQRFMGGWRGSSSQRRRATMDIEKLDINAVCFGILCNFTPVGGEERAKEAVERRTTSG